MSLSTYPAKLLRAGLLDRVCVLVAGAPALADGAGCERASDGDGDAARVALVHAVEATCGELGARVRVWTRDEHPGADTDLLVVDAGEAFAGKGTDREDGGRHAPASRAGLGACLDAAWQASSSVANAAFIEPGRSGRIVYVAPAAPARSLEPAGRLRGVELHDAARAGLENLARTLSIEWARYGITTVAIAPSERTSNAEIAALVAYLASPAGAYFSGCLLDLRGPDT